MIGNPRVMPTIPCTDIERAKKFYGGTLGLRELKAEDPAGGTYFEASPGASLYVYPRPEAKAEHTLAAFVVTDIEKAVADLRGKGVKFEDYDIPEMGIKTVDGIATTGEIRTAWFTDPDQNILALESNPYLPK